MKEIFVVLALVGVVLLGMTLFQGQKADIKVKESVHPHIGWALAAGVYLMVLHGIVFTYFMGTGFAVKEAVEEYSLDQEFLTHARKLKVRVFPLTVLAVLSVVFSIIFGTAAFTSPSSSASLHRGFAYLTLFLNFGVLYVQLVSITENGKILEDISNALPEEGSDSS